MTHQFEDIMNIQDGFSGKTVNQWLVRMGHGFADYAVDLYSPYSLSGNLEKFLDCDARPYLRDRHSDSHDSS